MKDNEIIKALENCGGAGECQKCPLNNLGQGISLCVPHLTQSALDLINRQESEIERLQKNNEYILMRHKFDRRPNGDCWNDVIEKAKSEAIKELWASLKEIAYLPNLSITGEYVIDVSDGDNLVKEMVGDAE